MFHEMPLKMYFMNTLKKCFTVYPCLNRRKPLTVFTKHSILREGYIVKFFFQSISWNTVSGTFDETETLSWNTFTLIFKFHCKRFSSIKKIVFTEKRYLLKFNSIKQYLLPIKQKQKRAYLNETMVENQELRKCMR